MRWSWPTPERGPGLALLPQQLQLGQHLAYKARRAGVPFLEMDPAYTSQRCPRRGHTERANRPTRDRFCSRCSLVGSADVVAGVNVRNRACSAWVFVTTPVPAPARTGRTVGSSDP
ncbi:transposase [Streptomyces sp. CA-210063]|nr:transposase [Streptomyces sp. CA-210063]